MHITPWDKAASPLKDRLLLLIGKNADSDDPDADGAGLSDETDHSDDEDLEQDERGELDASELEGDEDPYKKRFADTKADRDRLKREKDALEAERESLRLENEQLRRQQSAHHTDTGRAEIDEVNETQEVMDIAEAVNRDYLSLPNEKRNVKTMTELIVSKTLKKMREDAAKISQQEAARVINSVKGKETARQRANEALTAVGLDPDKHFPIMRTIINNRMDSDPGWFDRTGRDLKKQYETLATETRDYLVSLGATLSKKQVRDAQDQLLREEAGGVIAGGSRRANDSPRQAADDDDPAHGNTMIAAMAANRRSLVRRAERSSGVRR